MHRQIQSALLLSVSFHGMLVTSGISRSDFTSAPQILGHDYYLEYCLPAFERSLDYSVSNMFNVAYVIVSLKHYLPRVADGSISRNQLPYYMVCFHRSGTSASYNFVSNHSRIVLPSERDCRKGTEKLARFLKGDSGFLNPLCDVIY